MKTPDQNENSMINEVNELRQRTAELRARKNEQQQTEKPPRESEDRLKIILESIQAGIVIIDSETHRIVDANPMASRLIGAPKGQIIGSLCHKHICPAEEGQCPITDLGETVDNAECILLTAGGERCPVIKTAVPVVFGGRKHLVESFAAISKRKQATQREEAEEALRKSEGIARRMAHENAIVAEIGRIISSSLSIEDIYERFAEKVRQLISFDWISVSIIDREKGTLSNTYNSGDVIPGRGLMEEVPLAGSITGEVMRTRSSQIIELEDADEVASRFPKLSPFWRRGYRSFMANPLISNDQVLGVLHINSKRSKAFNEADASLGARIAAQIAGAMANAQLFSERKRAEEALQKSEEEARRLAKENATMAEIGRIISSTLNIEEVYERFAAEARKLIPFDRIMVALNNPGDRTATVTYASGFELEGRRIGDVYPIAHSAHQEIMRTRASFLIQPEAIEELEGLSTIKLTFQAGLRSIMTVPLISRDQVIGALHFRSKKFKAYTDRDLKLAERIGNQIAGAIANAQFLLEGKRAEEALQRSEEEARRLAQENAVMAEIGRIISSTLKIEEVYERFAAEARKLIPFDRIVVFLSNPEEATATVAYTAGLELEGRSSGDAFPLAHTVNEEVMRTRMGLLLQPETARELEDRFPLLIPSFQAGLRSMMVVPLMSRERVYGTLHLRSKKSQAYTGEDLRLAERIGAQIAGAIANAQLFLERKRAEEALRKSEERFRDLYDSAPVGYHEYDTEGRITNVNRRDLEMLGYSQEEIIGQYIWKFNVGEDIVHQEVLEKLQGLRPPGHSLERTFCRRDGSTFPVLIEDRLNKDEQGRITGIRSAIQDISGRKRVEEELLRAKEAADAANRAKSEFLANMSHELRTPLNHIIGFTELVVAKQCGDLNEVQKDYLNDVLQSSRHLLSLINDILDLSKVEAGKLELNLAETPLRMLLEGSLSMVKEKAMKHGIRLSSDVNGIPEAIQADERKLKQILYNLLSNAVKFTQDGGSVTLSSRYLSFREGQWFSPGGQPVGLPWGGDDLVMKGKGLIEISVQDTGIGIKGEDLQRIFNPFEQVESSASRKYPGSGLGLSLSRRLVELHGGKIWAESPGVGKGTKFTVVIPSNHGYCPIKGKS